MARFRGAGTGANRGWWVMQPRDAKKRWIEEFGVGAYSIGSDRFTGQVVGFNSADSIDVERRTKNGSPTEATVDTIDPSTIEMMDVKALLDKAPGLSDEQMAKARNSSNNRPKAGSYPTGTVFTSDSGKYTKQGADSWSDGDGNSLNNKQMDERLDADESSSAEVPEDAELTSDNILEAVDGSSLSWNNKQYSRLEGKWYDERTGKPVSDKTMAKKTDGDLSPEGGKDSFTPTPASEYPTDTKLHAEMNDGESTADLHKTDDNEWRVQTEENTADADDATADKVIEAADTLDLDDFLLNPTESEPAAHAPNSPKQLEDELDATYKDWNDLDVPKYDDDENPIPLTDDERAELERIRDAFERISADSERFEDPEDARYAKGIKTDADNAVDDINSAIENNSREDAPTSEETESEETNEAPRAEIETSTDEPVDERVETLRDEIDSTDDKASLEDIERELADLDNQLKDSENNDDVIARERIAEARVANNEKYALLEAQEEDETEELPQSGADIAWEEEDASAFDEEVKYYEDAITNGYRTQVTKEKPRGERAHWRTEVYDNAGDLVGEETSSTQKKARDAAARMVREDAESEDNTSTTTDQGQDTPEDDSPLEDLDRAVEDGTLRKAGRGVAVLNKIKGKDDSGVSEVSQEEFDALESPVMYRGVSKPEYKDDYYDDVKLGNGGNGEGVYFSDDKAEARRFANGDASSDNKMIEAKLADDAKVVTGDELLAEVAALPEDSVSADYVRSLTPTEQAAALGYDAVQAERNGDTITIVTNPSKLVSPQREPHQFKGPKYAEKLRRDSESKTDDPDNTSTTTDQDQDTTPEAEAEAEAETRTTDDIITDLDTTGAAAIDAISDGSDDDLDQARTNLLDTYQEAQRAIDDPNTSNEDKVRLQSKVEEVDRAVTAIDQEIESRRAAEEGGWVEDGDNDAIHILAREDGAQLETVLTEDGDYRIAVYPPGSDDDIAPWDSYSTREEANEAAEKFYASYDPDAANLPDTFSDEDLEGGYQADPEPNDDTLSAPDVDTVERETQEAAEDGTLDVEEVDSSADFTPTPDIPLKRSNAEKLANPQEGDIIVTASGRRSEYIGGGQWQDLGKEMTVSNEAQKEINKSSSETIAVGSAGEDVTVPVETAFTNKHDISLQGGQRPDSIRILNEDGTSEVYTNHNGRWHRRLDSKGTLAPSPTDRDVLHGKINASRQTATHKNGHPAVYYGEKELTPETAEAPTPSNEPSPNEGGGLASPEAKHVPATAAKKPALGSNIVNRPAKTEPNKVLMQDGKRVGMSDSEGNTYFVGDRVIYTDRSNNVRSARITAVSERGKYKKPAFDMVLDEHDPETPEDRIPFDEWYAMSGKERVAAGLPKTKYSKTKSMYQDSLSGNMRHASDEGREEVRQEHQTAKEQGLVTGTNVAEPEILNDVSSDRVVRDGSTAIIGTTNKYGELFQRGEVVEYGPNGEVGTIVHIGEADDRIRIAPNGQSTLESEYYHVDTISHSNKPATYYDKNYDLDAQDRVARDRFNNELRVGDTVYRYGFPFTVKDIYPDGSKIRVVGQDWAGEQGSKGSLSTSQLIDLGFDEDAAKEMSGAREHDFMPDHLQVFSGNAEDIKSIRTHDSHMMTLTRDSQGRVLDTQENRDALASRAIGNKGQTKVSNSALARYIAENGDSERYERAGIKPGDFIDSGVDQAASDNLQQYIELVFGTDMVIPDNTRMGGFNKFGQPESYIKKDGLWYLEGVEDAGGMTAQQFFYYRQNEGYRTNPGAASTDDVSRGRLTYMGDADDYVVPKAGTSIKKSDPEKFTLMPVGSLVRFTDAEGNVITIRKAPDGQWYKVSTSGSFSGSRKPVVPSDIPGTATYRGHVTTDAPAPKTDPDYRSEDAIKRRDRNQARGIRRNKKKVSKGGDDDILGTHISAEKTFREALDSQEDIRGRRDENERLAAERDALAKRNEALLEALRKAGIDPDSIETDDDDSLTASGNRIVATRKGTDHVLAVYNRVSDNVWEHVSAKGYRREFVLEAMPSTPGVTYKVEEHVA